MVQTIFGVVTAVASCVIGNQVGDGQFAAV